MKKIQLLSLLIFLTLLLVMAIPASAQDDGSWEDPENHTLFWGDEINVSGYLIRASDFSQSEPFDTEVDYVVLSIEDNKSNSWSAVLGANNSVFPSLKVVEDKFKIKALNVTTGTDIPTPYAEIEVYIANETKKGPVSWINDTLQVSRTAGNEMYIDQRVHVTISITNLKGLTFDNITIAETLPEGLIFDPDVDLDSSIKLDPYEKFNYHYSVRALRPGTYALQPTEISLERFGIIRTVSTNATNLTFNGPYINLTKTAELGSVRADGSGYMIDITVNITNEGDRAAYTSIVDTLPPETTLAAGSLEFSKVLVPSDEESISYSIFTPMKDTVSIPSVTAEFSDSKGYSKTVKSKSLIFDSGFGTDDSTYTEEVANTSVEVVTETTETNSSATTESDIYSPVPGYGKITSIRSLYTQTLEIINEALGF
ncbi:hypothetical protein J2755_000617 [Methanohalophilus levihalophilus]|uniref:hypothetical protein n=1 Tax=Methanohalophilus levihalophilus TaxID=1431282 RepID=UPI001AE5DC03|nr:hypothetical protein [Methanohalophilus levihalophilus]MBP2029697.1 hypothetical protein [Methanohalophilus levihalophilus]